MLAPLELGKVKETRLEPQVSPEEPELNPWATDSWVRHCQVCGLKIILLPRLRERTQLAQGQGGAWKKDDSSPPTDCGPPKGRY